MGRGLLAAGSGMFRRWSRRRHRDERSRCQASCASLMIRSAKRWAPTGSGGAGPCRRSWRCPASNGPEARECGPGDLSPLREFARTLPTCAQMIPLPGRRPRPPLRHRGVGLVQRRRRPLGDRLARTAPGRHSRRRPGPRGPAFRPPGHDRPVTETGHRFVGKQPADVRSFAAGDTFAYPIPRIYHRDTGPRQKLAVAGLPNRPGGPNWGMAKISLKPAVGSVFPGQRGDL